jgi:copper chaperone CopZ
MKIQQLAAKPKLIEITIDKQELVEKYGESVTFHFYDRQPLDVFAKLATATKDNVMEIASVIEKLILDEAGNPVMKDGEALPIDVLMEAINLISQHLGK